MTDSLKLARLLQLCSPALPVGAYAYSQALESAIHAGHVTDAESAGDWIAGVFRHGLVSLDLPALLLAWRAWQRGDGDRVQQLDDYLGASRETSELLLEDKEMGRSLSRVLRSLSVSLPDTRQPSFATTFGCAGAAWSISETDLLTGFSFSWLENQVGIATKTIPLGQTEAQQLLAFLSTRIDSVPAAAGAVADDNMDSDITNWDFGYSLPSLAILSSQHETLESRLYRS